MTNVLPTMCSSVSNLMSNLCLDIIFIVRSDLYSFSDMKIFMHLMKTVEMNEKYPKYQGGALPKLLISQLLSAL